MPPLIPYILQLFLTIYYFFYYLAKGKPEWECPKEKHGGESPETENVCCAEDLPIPMSQSREGTANGMIAVTRSKINQSWRRFVEWIKRICETVKTGFSMEGLRNGLKRMGVYVISILGSAWQIISTFFSTLFSFLLFRRAPSKTMPTSEVIYSSHGDNDVSIPSIPILSTPVPFSPSSSILSPPHPPPPPPPPPLARSNRVPSSHKEEVASISNDVSTVKNDEERESCKGGAFYSTRVFATNEEGVGEKGRQKEEKSMLSTREAVKGGIAVFPPSMMAEIAGSGGASSHVTRSEVNRTPNRTVKERLREASLTPTHKGTFEYSNGIIPNPQSNHCDYVNSKWSVDVPKGWKSYNDDRRIRAKSAGPPRVSRIEDSSSNEAQFIFRAHGSDGDMGYNNIMTRSEYYHNSSIERTKPMMSRERESRATTPSIWSCNTSRVSTPAFNIREEEVGLNGRGRRGRNGRVGETARSWPPPPNAEGADIGKECFIDGEGIITTACTRIVQKKNEESWKWFDDKGGMIDEKKEFSLMGDRDEVKRSGPNQGNHYSQHYFVDRDGKIKFENTHREYDRDYVIESVCRNY